MAYPDGGRRTPLESVRRRRFNPFTPHAGKSSREERHGQGSAAQHQGEEEAEGRVEQEEEGRSQPFALRADAGADTARAEPVRKEELAAPSAPAPTPRRSSSPPRNGGHRSSTS